MVVAENSRWKKLTVVVLLLLQFIQLEAVFIGKESCDFEASEVLDVDRKMWLMSGDDISVASTFIGQQLYFPPNSVFKVSIRKDNTTVIEAQHPQVMVYRLSNVTQLQIVSGELSVSCLNDRKRAEEELLVVETSTDSSSTDFSSETDPSYTPFPEDAAASAAIHPRARSFTFADSIDNGFSNKMKNATPPVITTTETTHSDKEITKEEVLSDEPVTPNTTSVKVATTSTTRKMSAETKSAVTTAPSATATSFAMSETEMETSQNSVIIPRTPANAPVPPAETSDTETTSVRSPTVESQSSSSMAVEPESNAAPFKVEDHVPYFAACGVLLLVTALVAATICIVQRRRSRRRSLDNHEDLFITSTYDDMLLRNSESVDDRTSRVMMYGDEPVALDPHELEARVLGGITEISADDDEKPRCLANH